jgi:hypothetical protein
VDINRELDAGQRTCSAVAASSHKKEEVLNTWQLQYRSLPIFFLLIHTI